MKLKNYILLEKIGFGSFGEVYKVEDQRTNEIYAAKISTKVFSELGDDFQKNFDREVGIIKKIHHPSILKFVGLSMKDFHDEDKPVIITEYLPNGSLGGIIDKSSRGCAPDNWNDTMKLINIYGIASAMAFLHANNIIHRDLKPDNILMDEYLFPILADFGLSKDTDIETSTIQVKGTPVYIAPEIWIDNDYSPKSDVYAFAYVVYEILTDKKPFNTNLTMYKLSKMVCDGKRPDLSIVPEPYCDLIERCWQQNAEDRPSSEEIINELENNDSYITELVEESDFQSYINYIKESPKSFDSETKKIGFNSKGKKAIKKTKIEKEMIYPEDEFDDLPKKCQNLINQAKEDTNMQYEVGNCLIRGLKGFPENVEIGVQYLQKAIKGGSIEAVILYNRMLIIGKKIPGDLKEAKENLANYDDQKNPEIIFLQAMIEKKEQNYAKAIRLLKKSIKANHGEAMFELGKMLYLGDGCEQNVKEAERYFKKAVENGCSKSDKFLEKQKTAPTKPKSKYNKKIDLVILIDGQIPNRFFYEAVSETIETTAQKMTKKYPKTLFRFGVVIYRDLILSQKKKSIVKDNPIVFDLTPKIEEIKPFLDGYQPSGGGVKSLNDWARGYAVLNEEISWDEKATKIVIQIGGTPGYGKNYSMKSGWFRKFFKVPSFNKKNSDMQNEREFQNMQERQNGYFYNMILNIAKVVNKFYCINGNINACYCYNEVQKVFNKKNKNFVVKDVFGYTSSGEGESADIESLTEEVNAFFLKVVESCKDAQDDNELDSECREQFQNDFKKFLKKLTEYNDSDDDDDNDDSNDDDDDDDKSDSNNDSSDDDDDGVIITHHHTQQRGRGRGNNRRGGKNKRRGRV